MAETGSKAKLASLSKSSEDEQRDEIDVLLPMSTEVKLSSGTVVTIVPLKLREMLRLIRIVTRGGAQMLPNLRFAGASPMDFAAQLVAIVLFSLPEAEDEAVEFVRAMVRPTDLRSGSSDADKAYNSQQQDLLAEELSNPELDDVVSIFEVVVSREAADLQSLGKRLRSAFSLAEKVGQVPTGTNSSVGSPPPPT
jgi:hypothetical protein